MYHVLIVILLAFTLSSAFIDATRIESTTPFAPIPSTMQAAMEAERAAAAVKRKHRSRLISEMARDATRNSDSIASSTGSNHGTVSTDSTQTQTTDFSPEKDEAIMSTLQMNKDFSQKLPQIRDTAKKCGRWAPRPQQSYVVDTSAIGRAFPDFSGGISSDDDFSLEVGRGNTRPNKNNSNNIIYTDNSNNEKSPIVNFGNHQILHTPHNPHATTSEKPHLQDASRNSLNQNTSNSINSFKVDKKESIFNRPLSTTYSYNSPKEILSQNHQQKHVSASDSFNIEQKENVPPKSNKVASPYTSNASRIVNGKRRTLHARVRDDSDMMDSTLSSTRSNAHHQEAQAPSRPETSFDSALSNKHRHEAQGPFNPENSIDSGRSTTQRSRSTSQRQHPQAPFRLAATFSSVRPSTQPQEAPPPSRPDNSNISTRPQSGSRSESHAKTRRRNTPSPTPLEPSSRSRANSQKLQTQTNTAKSFTPNPTQSSFVAPPAPDSSEHGTATFDMGVPVSVQNGKVQPRNASSRYRRGEHDRVDAFDLPDEEEDIYFMCDRQKVQIAELKEERARFDRRIKELEMENAQMKHEQAELKMEKKHWDSHKCIDQELEIEVEQYRKEKKFWDMHKCVDKKLEKEVALLRSQRKGWELHQCVDERLEMELAQLKLDKAQYKLEKKNWDTHKCVDKELEREIAHLRIEKKAWEAHECRDDELEEANAQLKHEARAWETQKCVDRGLQKQVAQLKMENKKALQGYESKDKEFQEQITQLKNEMKEWESHQSSNRGLEAENSQLKLEKKSWEAHRCADSGFGDSGSGSERSSTRYKQLKIENTRLEEKFTTLVTRYETLEKQYLQAQRTQRKSRKDDDMTSAFIIPDIISDIGDEPTLRPVMGPVEALARAMQNKRNEIADLKEKLAELHERYEKHECSIGRRERLRIETEIKRLVDAISGKSNELYLLHDIELAQEEGSDEKSLPWEGVEDVVF